MNFDPSQSATRKPYTPAPQGMHFARCVSIIDLGTQDGQFGAKRKMNVTFELLGTQMPREQATDPIRPFTISKEYTTSFNSKSTWRKDVSSWLSPRIISDGETVSSKDLLGRECMVLVTHKMKKDGSGVRADITAITPVMQGQQAPPAQNEVFEFEIGATDQFVQFPKVHSWMRDKICLSPEFQSECQKTGQVPHVINQQIKDARRNQNQNNAPQQPAYQQPQAMQPNHQFMQQPQPQFQQQPQQPWQQQPPAGQPQYPQQPPAGYQQPPQYPQGGQPQFPQQPQQQRDMNQQQQPAQQPGFGQPPITTGFGQPDPF